MINRNKGDTFLNISATYAQTGSSFVVPSSISKAGCDNLVKNGYKVENLIEFPGH